MGLQDCVGYWTTKAEHAEPQGVLKVLVQQLVKDARAVPAQDLPRPIVEHHLPSSLAFMTAE